MAKQIAEKVTPKVIVPFIVALFALGTISLAVQDDPQNEGAYALLVPVLMTPAEASCANEVCAQQNQYCQSDSNDTNCKITGPYQCKETKCYP